MATATAPPEPPPDKSRTTIMTDAPVSRRDFARHAALATGSLVAATAGSVRGDDANTLEPALQQPLGQGGPFPPPQVEDFFMMAMMQEFPSEHLTDQQLGGIRAGMTYNRRRAERMRRYPLENGDGPATVFRARRA